MLDSKATDLDKEERPEVRLSFSDHNLWEAMLLILGILTLECKGEHFTSLIQKRLNTFAGRTKPFAFDINLTKNLI